MGSLIRQTIILLFLVSLAAAYFEVDVQSVEQLSGTDYLDISKLKVRKDKTSKTRKIYGNVSMNFDMDNTFKETILLYKKQGGEYRKMPYKIPEKGICDFLKEDTYVYPEFAEHSDFSNPWECPTPIGVYAVHGYQPSLKNFPNYIMVSGDYAAEVLMTKNGEVSFKARFYVSIINI